MAILSHVPRALTEYQEEIAGLAPCPPIPLARDMYVDHSTNFGMSSSRPRPRAACLISDAASSVQRVMRAYIFPISLLHRHLPSRIKLRTSALRGEVYRPTDARAMCTELLRVKPEHARVPFEQRPILTRRDPFPVAAAEQRLRRCVAAPVQILS